MVETDESRGGSGRLALVTGATGYVGGRLVGELLERGWRVRVLSRDADKLADRPWADRLVPTGEHAEPGQVEAVEGDASERSDVDEAMTGVDVAWYLLHSMGEGDDFVRQEKDMARGFGAAAAQAGVSRIVYLGGLHPDVPTDELSEHLAGRVAVGEELMASGVPTAALQAGVVLGDGSESFSMLRHLSERLPAAVAPSWLRNRIQPIAVDDVLHYLVAAADLGPTHNRTFDVGGPDVVAYGDMMKRYAEVVGLPPRFVATAPVTTPGLASYWIGLVTPVQRALAKPLIGSLLHDTVVGEQDLPKLVGPPPGGPTTFDDAVRSATADVDTRRWRRTLAGTAAAVAATAVVGSIASDPTSRWYAALRKPAWNPPNWVFPIAWTSLYADIAGVGALCLADLAETGREEERRAYVVALGTNLALNAAWSAIFFRARNLPAAALGAAALAASSADLVRRSAAVSPEKGAVLAPYAAWTAFATALSARIASLNPR